jgi:hypothetical protein
VAYEPNPFVNPNQRGVELPAGCKDLMDVLKLQPVAEGSMGTARIDIGKTKDIPGRVAAFLGEKKSQRLLSVTSPARHIFVTVMCRDEEFSLNLFVFKNQIGLRDALRRIFADKDLCRGEREPEFVNLPLSGSAVEIVKVLTELLVEGCGVTEEESLLFHGYGRAGTK